MNNRLLLGLILLLATISSTPACALVILQYHHIATDTPRITSTRPEEFAAHMAYLQDEGFNIVSLSERLDPNAPRAGTISSREVAITFDDAYRSIYTEAFPRLKALGWPFTIFVASNLVSEHGGQYLTWAELKQMQAQGAEIANHSTAHQHWARRPQSVSESSWRAQFTEDTLSAQAAINAHFSQAPKHYALPYGEYYPDLLEDLDHLGYLIFGQQSGAVPMPNHPLVIPRFPMGGPYAAMDSFKTKVNSLAFDRTVRIHNPVLSALETRPIANAAALGVTSVVGLNCFGPAGAIVPLQVGKGILIQSDEPLKAGRHRYNCTRRDDRTGRYQWHSFFWMKQRPDNTWYPEP